MKTLVIFAAVVATFALGSMGWELSAFAAPLLLGAKS